MRRASLIASWAASGAMGAGMAMALAGAAPRVPERLEARELAIVDAAGRDRIVLGGAPMAGARGEAYYLTIQDREGREQVAIQAADAGAASLTLSDRAGHARLSASLVGADMGQERQEPILTLRDEHGQRRLSLSVGKAGASVRVHDEAGKVIPAR